MDVMGSVADNGDEIELSDTLETKDAPKSSRRVLMAIEESQKTFMPWRDVCRNIDDIYSLRNDSLTSSALSGPWTFTDAQLDLFWSSFEILKVAVYARAPQPAVSTEFKDKRKLQSKTAEVLERVGTSAFRRSNIHDVMCHTRDDVIFDGRGVIWVSYESDEKGGGQRACIDHVDRNDFAHEAAREWCQVGWVGRRVWMTRKDMRKRFSKSSGKAYQQAKLWTRRDAEQDGAADSSRKASVWEVWHRADNKVYWVSEGCDVVLDESEPYLKIDGFFPCPRPAYATLARRSLIPVPDYQRYATHFAQINTLTARIYLLLDKVQMKGLIPAGGDVADAVQELIASNDDQLLIGVPSAALMASGGQFVQWLPLVELASAIQGLIDARAVLINNFYELSGISDIMRGATEASETLGAQQLKSQYGSVRVQEKVRELQRIAADTVKIVCEIVSEEFDQETILEMCQMEIPSKRDIEKQIQEIEKAAKADLDQVGEQAKQMVDQARQQGQQVDPQQAQQQFVEAQQQVYQKYAPQLDRVSQEVSIEAIMDLLRDDRARNFAFEIESDSTIYADEQAEKEARNEFMAVFNQSTQALTTLAAMGEEGAKLAGGMLKFVLGPYRVGRELDSLIDSFIDAAPAMAERMQAQNGGGDNAELIKAQQTLAQAEVAKAQAQMEKVKADTELRGAEQQRKMMEMQEKSRQDQAKMMGEMEKLRQSAETTQADLEKTRAEIDKTRAQTAEILNSIGLDVKKQQLEEYKTVNQAQNDQFNQAQAIVGEQRADRGELRADRQQDFAERSGDRQQTLAERQAMERTDV